MPHVAIDDGGGVLASGTAVKQWAMAGLNLLRRSEYEVAGVALSPAGTLDVVESWTPGEEAARAVHSYDVAGLLMESHRWHGIGRDAHYTDRFEYDALGRVSKEMFADGRVVETEYDYDGRVKRVSEGTSNGTVLVEERFYDHVLDGGVPSDGIGDGNLTLIRSHVGDGTTRDDVTVYDWRNRARLTYLADGLGSGLAHKGEYTVSTLDRLGRAIETAVIGGGDITPALEAIDSGAFDAFEQRMGSLDYLSYKRTSRSGRGLVTRRERAINPNDSSTGFLVTNFAHDNAGSEVATVSPSGRVTKRSYDGLGRVVFTSETDGFGLRNGAPFEEAVDPLSETDTIFEVSHTSYGDTGLAEVNVTSRRAGAGLGIGDSAVATSTATVRDWAGRPIATVEYGVDLPDGRDVFARGGNTRFEAPSTVPTRDGAYRVTETRYDARGRAFESVDAEGRVTRTVFDDLDRAVAVVENYVAPSGGELDVAWSPALGIYEVTNRPSPDPDENRVTSTVYDASDREVRRVAHVPSAGGDEHQITEFVYSPVGLDLSGLGNLSLSIGPRYEIRYPDPETGLPSAAEEDRVRFAYNWLGEQIASEDQNGTIRRFARDASGRMVADYVAGVRENGLIDRGVEAIGTEYDEFGRVMRVRSAVATDDGVLYPASSNELIYEYKPLGQIGSLTQVGQPYAAPMVVGLEWDTRGIGSGNEDRRHAIVYPNGTRLGYSYGSEGSADDLADRVRGLTFNDPGGDEGVQALVEYEYMGLASVSSSEYVMPGVRMDRRVERDGSTADGEYPGWDRFGRLKLHSWVRNGFWTNPSDPDSPSEPALVQDRYVYDLNSNRLSKTDARVGSFAGNTDWRFAYDGLDRLVTSQRGKEVVFTGGGGFVASSGGRVWTLDALGNWEQVSTDGDGDGLFDGTGDVVETRAHNMTNEYESSSRVSGDQSASEATEIERTHDENGNLLRVEVLDSAGTILEGWRYTYDAWNRLTEVEMHVGAGWVTVARHEYNGLHWRVRELMDTSALVEGNIPDGELDRERLFAYTPEWQMVYESVDEQRTGNGHAPDRQVEYYWGVRADDDSIGRRVVDLDGDGIDSGGWAFTLTDGLFSVVAEVDASGELLRRVSYDSYGRSTMHWPLDIDRDGDVDGDDSQIISDALSGDGEAQIGDANYNADADFVAPFGVIDQADASYFSARYQEQSTTPIELSERGTISVGYAGYHGDELTGFWHARHRWYDPEAGRWLTRDPAGYVDGLSLYLYVGANPLGFIDPTGLAKQAGFFEAVGYAIFGPPEGVNAPGVMEGFAEGATGGAHNIANSATMGATDAAGITNSSAYQGSEFAVSKAAGHFARETAIAVTTGGAGNVALKATSTTVQVTAKGVQAAGQAYNVASNGQAAAQGVQAAANGNYGQALVDIGSAATGTRVRWKAGDALDVPTPKGTPPSRTTIRERYWRNKAHNAREGEYDAVQMDRMRRGRALQKPNKETGEMESVELHHDPAWRDGGRYDVTEMTPAEHAQIDDYRHLPKDTCGPK